MATGLHPVVAVHLLYIFIQAAAASAILLSQHATPRIRSLLSALFCLNGAVSLTLLLGDPAFDWVGASPSIRFTAIVDAPTGFLMLAVAAAYRRGDHSRAVTALVAAAIAVAALHVVWPDATAWGSILSAIPFHAGLTALVLTMARGPGWARWITLAFLPRGLQWGATLLSQQLSSNWGLFDVWLGLLSGRDPVPDPAALATLVEAVTLLLMGLASVVAAALLLTGPRRGPEVPVAVPFLAVGPILGIYMEWVGSFGSYELVVQTMTMAALRPVILLLGLAPMLLVATSMRATFAAGVSASFLALQFTFLQPTTPLLPRMLLAVAVGAVALGLLSAFSPLGRRQAGARDGPLRQSLPDIDQHAWNNKYRVVHALGQGSFGTAYLAEDLDAQRNVVLKVPHPGATGAQGAADLRREARALAAVDHANVLRLHAVERLDGRPVLVVEHAGGGSLADRLSDGPLPPQEFPQVALGLLDGLAALHDAGLLHRDLKPANILLDGHGNPKVADLGIARDPRADATVTTDASPVGTVRYMAPEQARGEAATVCSDIYGAAALIYEAATGEPYVRHRVHHNLQQQLDRVAKLGPFDRRLGRWDHLRPWFENALHPAPEHRFATAAEAQQALKRILDRQPARPQPHHDAGPTMGGWLLDPDGQPRL